MGRISFEYQNKIYQAKNSWNFFFFFSVIPFAAHWIVSNPYSNRQLSMMHNDLLYHTTIVPDYPQLGDTYQQMKDI